MLGSGGHWPGGRRLKVQGARELVVGGTVMLCEVVTQVGLAGAPVAVELALADTVTDPVETHVHGLGPPLFNIIVADAGGAGIVDLDGSGRLGPSHFG